MLTIQTARLTLRPLEERDIDALLAMEADPEVTRYVGGPIDPDAARRQYIVNYVRSRPEIGHWAIDAGSGFIGWVSLTMLEEDGRHQLAYRLPTHVWGRGYATEAAYAILRHGFSELNARELVAVVRQDNAASNKVLKKLAFSFEKSITHRGDLAQLYVCRGVD